MTKAATVTPRITDPANDSITRRHTRRYHLGLSAAVLLTVGGLIGSSLAAGAVATTDNNRRQAAFARSSAAVAATLQLALQHENDLAVNAGGYLIADPDGSQADFLRWTSAVQLLQRYPEVEGLGALVIVSAA
jgi:CHASE1-domain containing sensor protein